MNSPVTILQSTLAGSPPPATVTFTINSKSGIGGVGLIGRGKILNGMAVIGPGGSTGGTTSGGNRHWAA